jgi:hypothetical protein
MTCLDELDEPVGGVEGELHPTILCEHVFVFNAEEKAADAAAAFSILGGGRRASP